MRTRRPRQANASKYPAALNHYFETANLTTPKGTTLKVVSDGRAGDGVTHWRAVYQGDTLVAGLSGEPGPYGGEVTIGKDGDLRKGQSHEFPNFEQAVDFLVSQF